MNVLLLTKHLNLGGIPRYVLDLGGVLTKKGHKVWVASSGGKILKELEKENITHIYIPIMTKSILSPKVILSWLKLKNSLKSEKIDIIHSHTRATSSLAYLLSKSLKIKYITTVHGLYKKSVLRKIFSFPGEFTIGISKQTTKRLIDWVGLDSERVKTIPNGIDISKFTECSLTKKEARETLGISSDDFVIGNISRIEKIKGQEMIINSIFHLKNRIPNLKFILIGEGRYKPELIKLVNNLELKNRVIMLPGLEDVKPALRAMDLFCFTPFDEPFGLVLLEAMAMKVPIIASNVSEVPEILNYGNCGIIIPPGDEKCLCDAIKEVYEEKIATEKMVAEAFERVKNNYSRDDAAQGTIKVYEDVLKKCKK